MTTQSEADRLEARAEFYGDLLQLMLFGLSAFAWMCVAVGVFVNHYGN